jgi:hypothetical protein
MHECNARSPVSGTTSAPRTQLTMPRGPLVASTRRKGPVALPISTPGASPLSSTIRTHTHLSHSGVKPSDTWSAPHRVEIPDGTTDAPGGSFVGKLGKAWDVLVARTSGPRAPQRPRLPVRERRLPAAAGPARSGVPHGRGR